MPEPQLDLEVVPAADVSGPVCDEVVALLDRAYGEPIRPYLSALHLHSHVLGRLDGVVVSHAAWVTRYLQAGSAGMMRAAYVELVATEPEHQGKGYAAAVMRLLADSIAAYDIGALCPSEAGRELYQSLGWADWRGPLLIRGSHGLIPTPEERVMVLRSPRTPALDLDASLSAEWRRGELW